MKQKHMGIIGYGNMAQAIVKGLISGGVLTGQQIYACAGQFDKLEKNCQRIGGHPCKTIEEVICKSDVIMIAVKPNMIERLISPVKELLQGKMVVSIVAGYTFDCYKEILGNNTHYICTIPNTPVAVGAGITICDEKHSLNDEELELFQSWFSALGLIQFVASNQMSIAGTLAGCAPAFASVFLEALGDAGVKYGLNRNVAYELAAQMLCGTGKLYMKKKTHPGAMKDAVCSPGGTTIRGVTTLEKNGFRNAVISAIDEIEG